MLVLLLLAAAQGGIPTPEPPDVSAPWRATRSCTAGGLAIYTHVGPADGVASVVTVVDAGMRDEPAGKAGLAHLVEHLWYRSRVRPTETVRDVVERLGVHNAFTQVDAITFAVEGGDEELGEMLALQGALLTDPLAGVDESTFAAERAVVQRELESGDDRWGRSAVRYVFPRLFPAPHPYAQAFTDHPGGVGSLTLDDARRFVATTYRPDRMTIFVHGGEIGGVERVLARVLPERALSASPPVLCNRPTEASLEPARPLAPAPLVSHAPGPARVFVGFAVPGGWGVEYEIGKLALPLLEDSMGLGFGRVAVPHWPSCDLMPARLGSVVLCTLVVGREADVMPATAQLQSGIRMIQDDSWARWMGAGADGFPASRVGAQLALLRSFAGLPAPVTHDTLEAHAAAHVDGTDTLDSRVRALSSIEWGHVVGYAQTWFMPGRAVWAHVLPGASTATVDSVAHRVAAPPPRFEVSTEQVRARARVPEPRVERLASGLELVLVDRPDMPLSHTELVFRGGESAEAVRGMYDVTVAREEWYARNLGYDPSLLAAAEGVQAGRWSGARNESFGFTAVPGRERRLFPTLVRMLTANFLRDDAADPAEQLAFVLWHHTGAVEALERMVLQRMYGDSVLPKHEDWRKAQQRGDPALLSALRAARRPEAGTLLAVGPLDVEGFAVAARAAFDRWPAKLADAPTPAPRLTALVGDARRGRFVHDQGQGGAHLVAACDSGGGGVPAAKGLARWLDDRVNLLARERAGASYTLRVQRSQLAAADGFLVLSGDVEPTQLGPTLVAILAELQARELDAGDADARRSAWLVATRERLLATTAAGYADLLRERAVSLDRNDWFARRADAYARFDGAALRAGLAACRSTWTWAATGPRTAGDSLTAAGLVLESFDSAAWWRAQVGEDTWEKVNR